MQRARWAHLWAALAVTFGVVFTLGLIWPHSPIGRYIGIDLEVYREGARLWREGGLYQELSNLQGGVDLPFIYPPFAAIVFTPLTLIPLHAASLFMAACSIAALGFVVHAFRPDLAPCTVGGLTVAAITLEPVRTTLGYGQINLLLIALVTLEFVRRPSRWPRGLGIGIAAAIKLTPLVFLLVYAVRRDWRGAAQALGCFVGFTALAAVLDWQNSRTFWTYIVAHTDEMVGTRYGRNQSLRAAISRLLDTQAATVLWLVACLIVVTITAIVAYRARQNMPLLIASVALCGLLVSPISWSHHWAWAIPLLIVGWRSGAILRITAASGAALFAVGPPLLVPSGNGVEARWSVLEQLAGNLYLIWGAAALMALLVASSSPRSKTRLEKSPAR